MSVQTFAQWESYYPEGKNNKKEVNNKAIDKDNFLYDTHLFKALKAKLLEKISTTSELNSELTELLSPPLALPHVTTEPLDICAANAL